jgi:hypothetical protein
MGRWVVTAMVVLFVAGSLFAVVTTAIVKAIRESTTTSCANNLSQLWKMIGNYRVQFG